LDQVKDTGKEVIVIYRNFIIAVLLTYAYGCSDSNNSDSATNNDLPQPSSADEAPFSNVILFGDSQSDSGNYPESIYYANDPNSSSMFKIATNLYVPVSNPISADIFDPLYPNRVLFPVNSSHYSEFTPSEPDAICDVTAAQKTVCSSPRQGGSVNWVQYFAFNASRSAAYRLFESIELAPWVALDSQEVKSSSPSINYAWFGAISPPTGCYNQNQTQLPIVCTRADISEGQRSYRASQQLSGEAATLGEEASYDLEDTMPVPTLYQQIELLFLDDLNNNSALVDDDTLYIVYNGANDLSTAFFDWVEGTISLEKFADDLWRRIPKYIVGTNNSAVEKLISGLAGKGVTRGTILIFPQYNVGITPEIAYTTGITDIRVNEAVAKLLGVLVEIFNTRLEHYTHITAQNNPEFTFYYLGSLYDNMSALAFSAPYTETFAQPCNDNTAIFNSRAIPSGEVSPCLNASGDPFLFWNTVHLAAPGQQVIASSALDWLAEAVTVSDTSLSSTVTKEQLTKEIQALDVFIKKHMLTPGAP
tara:strand:- start:1151 stop:2749 length:1599 start_codon:yes stop_codon:yes gene_type:complete